MSDTDTLGGVTELEKRPFWGSGGSSTHKPFIIQLNLEPEKFGEWFLPMKVRWDLSLFGGNPWPENPWSHFQTPTRNLGTLVGWNEKFVVFFQWGRVGDQVGKPLKLHLGILPVGRSLFSETPVRRPVGQIRYLVGEVHSNTVDGRNPAPPGM